MLWTLIKTIWLFLPAYTPNNFAVIFGGGKPIDLGKNFVDGKRILGDGKTFRGFFGGLFGGLITGLAQYKIEQIAGLEFFTTMPLSSALTLFLLLSLGSLTGDLLGSFIKRRLGIERGGKAPLLDQLDFLVVAIVFASFHEYFSSLYTAEVIVIALILTPLLHKLINVIAYLLRLKDVPW
ncbi:CDP-diglyceride synthetase [Geoglobus ahangari]|uniref:CDP-archaeol synthase n=1 Tax=Geoglobus ahangari TaxID=113653 RepID=A0A0F7DCA0_9EURY|nr:CDP-2,3-bis-(O-geranylgeranyl)-sn-glycerol synthase [Geoglobus ahangari]AKG92476.1 CDP-diglyceride synthetase [Geoglobus ahangari]